MSAQYSSESTHTAKNPVTISLDAMGGDVGPEVVIPGAAIISKEYPHAKFLLFGDKVQILEVLDQYKELKKRVEIIHTEKSIRSDERPSLALRSSKGTSMRMAIEAVHDGRAQAVVSAGNTGALMALAKVVLKPLPGIHRPAIASLMPTMKGSIIMLDLGANTLVDAENLAQFAVLGAVFSKINKNIDVPSVGLLNVGTEDTKGPDHVRSAANILTNVDFPGRYYGFVEGTDITKGTVDVVVCDGYAGNIALKTIEGMGMFSKHSFKKALGSDPLAKLGSLLAFFALKRFKKTMDPRLYNGGVFLGLNGLCVKSHGGTDALGFSTAIRRAINLSDHGYIKRVSEEINHLMSQDSFLSQAV